MGHGLRLDTAQRAAAIAEAAKHFPALGPINAETLLDLVATELGNRGALDGFHDYGGASQVKDSARLLRTRAIAPGCVLHILAGNTPIAALQSLIRGLLLGSENLLKLPSSGLPEIDDFVARLPSELSRLVTLSAELKDDWLRRAKAIIVFGDDDTVHHFRRQTRVDQMFVAHGHAISFGVIFSDRDGTAAERAARDIGLYDQQGCLSPHCLYIDNHAIDAKEFAADLATAMANYEKIDPRSDISAGESAAITALRASYSFRAANDERVAIWQSPAGSEWTVIFETETQFAVSPLNRVVFVKPLPDGGIADLNDELRTVRPYLSSIAVHPLTAALAESLIDLGASRICALGEAQHPHPLWHQDGQAQLSPLVKWQDIG